MSSALVVEVPKRGDGAPAEWQVVGVDVRTAARSWTEVDGTAWKDAVCEVWAQVGVLFEEGAEAVAVVLVGLWCPCVECTCAQSDSGILWRARRSLTRTKTSYPLDG